MKVNFDPFHPNRTHPNSKEKGPDRATEEREQYFNHLPSTVTTALTFSTPIPNQKRPIEMMLKPILAALLPLLTLTDAAPSSNTCVTAIGIPSLDPLCLPLKAEGINLAPSPKFLFSKSDYCATFERHFASITIIKDSVPAGKKCTVTTFSEEGCEGKSKESSASDGCFQAALLLPTQRSAKLVCK
ncbi:MAG: hypothetical protein Q9169_006783 [Polycauliona sp. 2 TL-2023]